MIAQVLNRDFVLKQAAAIRTGLAGAVAERQRPGHERSGLDELSDAELGELIGELGVVDDELGAEAVQEQEGGGEAYEVRGMGAALGGAPPKDDYAFLPRSPLLSIVQTTIEEYVETQQPELLVGQPLADESRGLGGVPAVTDLRLAPAPLIGGAGERRRFGEMEVTDPKLFSDPRWLLSGVAMAWRAIRGRVNFNASPPPPIEIADDARIVVVGDWGSGIPRARKVADQMRAALDHPDAAGRQRHVIHLGDVYYSGARSEYRKRLLGPWPVRRGEDIGSFTLMGNHDMYLGGEPYYDTCLADPRFAKQDGCSYFALRSRHWQLLGLDTGYEDGGLKDPQASWVRDRLAEARQPSEPGEAPLRTALLSHHQLFSTHEGGAQRMADKLTPVLEDAGGVDAWLWGHEHRCIVYDAHLGVRFSSCVGHGGIPEYLPRGHGEPAPLYEYNAKFGDGEPWNTFGFAILDLAGDRLSISYVNEDGDVHHRVDDVTAAAG
jgi:hypothetical protein